MYYETYFGLNEAPFSISPDPRYLYLTSGHREALAHLLYGVTGGGGFVLLTGEVGAGKTTVCRCLLQQLPEGVDVALVLNPKLNAIEFLEAICDELGIELADPREKSFKRLVDYIYNYLLTAHGKGRNTVLIVDEAQNLAPDVIEHLRLLTNLETDQKKLLQIILIGQPELRDLLDSPGLAQMAQRITARFHLNVLSRSEAQGYIQHRLKVAACEKPLFNKAAIKTIWKRSSGVPRLMNAICDRALLGTSLANKKLVSREIAVKAANEVLGQPSGSAVSGLRSPLGFFALSLGLLAVIVVLLFAGGTLHRFWIKERPSVIALDDKMGRLESDRRDGAPVGKSDKASESSDIKNNLSTVIANGQAPTKSHLSHGDVKLIPDGVSGLGGLVDIPGLLQTSGDGGERSAYENLFQRWGIVYPPGNTLNDCDHKEYRGLRCLTGTDNLQELVVLNRPAVLNFSDEFGRSYKVTLLSLNEDKAVISVFNNEVNLPITELLDLWTGEYLLLWRPPLGFESAVKLGAEGVIVEWITRQLSESNSNVANGNVSRGSSFNSSLVNESVVSVYDSFVAQQVALFQQQHGLVSDGEVGSKTVIAINNVNGSSLPKLSVVPLANAYGSSSSQLNVAPE